MNLNQVTIPSIDLARSVSFYKKLGMKLIVDALPRYARFECPDGDATFSIHLVNELPLGTGIILYFECEDLNSQVTQLKENNIIFETPPTEQTWLWTEAHLKDPDNNQVILYHAGENRKNPPWRIN